MATPNTGIPYVPEGTLDPAAGLNLALNHIDGLLQAAVLGTEDDPPVTPPDGSQYIVGVGTGDWVGQDDNVARYVAEGDFWQFYTAGDQVRYVLDVSTSVLFAYEGSAGWTPISGGGTGIQTIVAGTNISVDDTDPLNPIVSASGGGGGSGDVVGPAGATADAVALFDGTTGKLLKNGARTIAQLTKQSFILACSDETTALTTGTGKARFRMPYAFTLTDIRASLTTAQASGSTLTVDINEGGTSILSTKLTIDNTESTSTTAAIPPVISDTAIADDAVVSVDIDQIGASGASGLKVTLIGYPT